MPATCLRPADDDAVRIEALAEAADAIGRQFPEALISSERKAEATIFLVAAALEGLAIKVPPALRLEAALAELSGLYRPLLQDDVTRHRLVDASRTLGRLIEPILTPIAWAPTDGELLGTWFEGGLAEGQRKRLGQFYTPRAIVDFLLDRALVDFDPRRDQPFRLLDPACGSGHFLAPAAARMVESYRRHRADLASLRPGECWDDDSLVHRVFRDHLVGTDIDPFAARVARIRLRLLALALGAQSPPLPAISHADALGPAGATLAGKFEAVVGNPPYGAQIDPGVARRYQLGRGRCDSTALFIERALELTGSGGRVAFVVPHGVTRTGAYAPCRRLLLQETRLHALLDAGQAFTGVNLETMAFVAERTERTEQNEAQLAGDVSPAVELWTMRHGPLERLGEQEIAFYRDRPTLSIYVPGEVGQVVLALEKAGAPLVDHCRIRRGSAISARDPALSDAVMARDCAAEGLPVVRGRDISRYSPLNELLRLGRQEPLFDLHAPDVLPRPRVGYQNIASGIVATRLPAGILPLDTVNVLEPLIPLDELALLGFLNSRLADFYFRVVIANMAQLTVHLDAPTIGSLPVPESVIDLIVAEGPGPLARLTLALLEARRSGTAAAQIDSLTGELDELVFDRAGLSAQQRSVILEATARRPARRRASSK